MVNQAVLSLFSFLFVYGGYNTSELVYWFSDNISYEIEEPSWELVGVCTCQFWYPHKTGIYQCWPVIELITGY